MPSMDDTCVFIDILLLHRGDSGTIAVPGCRKIGPFLSEPVE